MKEKVETKINENQDSIKVSKGMNGKYSWEIKIYYNVEETNPNNVIKKIKEINNILKKEFPDIEKSEKKKKQNNNGRRDNKI